MNELCRRKTFYEWDVETLDLESNPRDYDILDHNHFDKLGNTTLDLAEDERLVLVRDTYLGGSLDDRQWGYVKDGKLPEFFSCQFREADGGHAEGDQSGDKVPKRFHEELKKQKVLHDLKLTDQQKAALRGELSANEWEAQGMNLLQLGLTSLDPLLVGPRAFSLTPFGRTIAIQLRQ